MADRQRKEVQMDLYGQELRRRRVVKLQQELDELNDECARLEYVGPEHAWHKARSRRHHVANQLADALRS